PPILDGAMLDDDALDRVWREARLWSRVRVPRRDRMSACWIAPSGRIRTDGEESETLVRAVGEAVEGDGPDGMSVVHACATPTCVSPAHLELRRTRRWARPSKRRCA